MNQTLKALGACQGAIDWVGDRSLAEAWADCKRPDWMFWLLGRSNYDRKGLNEVLIDITAIGLEATRPMAGKEAYWAVVEAAHRQVAEAIRSGEGLPEARAAAEAARAACAAEAAAEAAETAWAAWAAACASARAAEAAAEAAWAAEAAEAACAAARAACAAAETAEAAAEAAWAACAAARAVEAAARAVEAAEWAVEAAICDSIRKHFPNLPILPGA